MKFETLRENLDTPVFATREIKIKNLNIFPYQLSFWTRKKKIGQLKKGVYYLRESRGEIKAEEVASAIYAPSYISLETALFNYGFLPDVPQSLTSVTTKTTRTFDNELGRFIFRHLSPQLFFGYTGVGEKGKKYLLAEPEKAILDYFYLNSSSVQDEQDLEELRFNYSEIKQQISTKKLKQYAKAFQMKKMDRLINIFIKNVNLGTN